MQKHSAFKAEADFMGGEEGKNIANHWCQLQTVIEEQFGKEGDAEQEDHDDTFSRKSRNGHVRPSRLREDAITSIRTTAITILLISLVASS